MANPQYGMEPATMFYAGDDTYAKQIAANWHPICEEPIDAGTLPMSKF